MGRAHHVSGHINAECPTLLVILVKDKKFSWESEPTDHVNSHGKKIDFHEMFNSKAYSTKINGVFKKIKERECESRFFIHSNLLLKIKTTDNGS